MQRTPFTYLNKPERVQGLNDAVDTLVCAIASDNEIPDLCDKSGSRLLNHTQIVVENGA